MNKNFKYYLLLFPLFGAFIWFLTSGDRFCDENKLFYHTGISGEVISIHRTFDNVKKIGEHTIFITNGRNDTIKFYYFDRSFSFEFQINDSVKKDTSTFDFKVIRNDSMIYEPDFFQYQRQCEDCGFCKDRSLP